MRNLRSTGGPKYYFALARLVSWLRGQDATRHEGDPLEARLPGAGIFLVTGVYALQLCDSISSGWIQYLFWLTLPVLVFFLWVLLFYLFSFCVRALRAVKPFSALPNSRIQSVLICGLTTVFAAILTQSKAWPRAVGYVWMASVFVNLAAALILFFADGRRQLN
ncbi:MAG TPA: hypothetical protein VGQ82_00755 [Chthoniobacterales bacterium]|nr:hypothetical protein [Chthoniobacterales bacterium]